MDFFDSHAHYNDERFRENRFELIEKMYNDEITNIVCAGYNLDGSRDAVYLANKIPHVFATCGISPNDIKNKLIWLIDLICLLLYILVRLLWIRFIY